MDWFLTYCVRDSWLLWPFVVLNIAIGAAYFAIPYRLKKAAMSNGGYLVSNKTVVLFRAFIQTCGLSHFTAVAAVLTGIYVIHIAVLLGTTVISWRTVIYMKQSFNDVDMIAKENKRLRSMIADFAETKTPETSDLMARLRVVGERVARI